ncbi:MAG: hypothetical protein HC933_05980 [Pleurocapsa sp. SU_196_0]|nr:hypothetical protein [Pleurocapsa sp. SU_196_0]
MAKPVLGAAPGWSYQGKCTIVFRFETAKLEFSSEARKTYQSYKTTDYVVSFEYDGKSYRYTFASP